MTVDLKPVEDQVMVITGATSGIGLTTARMAANRGASLVLAARSEDALEALTDEITDRDGDAVYVVADVREQDDVLQVEAAAEETYGGFDTWVNNAGAFLYGRLDETLIDDMRDLFETNVWGLLYGSLVAAEHLKQRGGAIINIGSAASDRAMLLQGAYSASKHAAKGFTDALRMELEAEDAPVSVTLVKPAAIDTPYPHHAKNYMDEDAKVPPPVYAPETVARAILHCAETPERDLYVGGAARNMGTLEHYAPGLLDSIMEKLYVPLQKTEDSPRPQDGNLLDEPAGDLEERGGYEGHVAERSLYTQSARRGLAGKALASLGVVAALAYVAYRAARGRGEQTRSVPGVDVERTDERREERRRAAVERR